MSHVGNHRRRRQPGRKGTASVEMALAAPILLTLVFGIMQIGYAYMAQHMVENAAYKGCPSCDPADAFAVRRDQFN